MMTNLKPATALLATVLLTAGTSRIALAQPATDDVERWTKTK